MEELRRERTPGGGVRKRLGCVDGEAAGGGAETGEARGGGTGAACDGATVFRMDIAAAAWSAEGADRIEFLVSANVGEEPKALEKVASGGEISRIALALKTCLTSPKSATVRTLVFDEVDAGVGGGAAEGDRAALEEARRREPGIVRDALAASGIVRGSPLPGGEAGVERAHGGGDGRVGWRRADARDRANALGTEAHRRSAATRRTTNSTERPLVPTAVLPPVRHDILP